MTIETENPDDQNADQIEDKAGAAAAAGEGGGENETSTIYKPEGIPDGMVGKTDQETIDNILKGYKGARTELAKKSGVPEKFEDYKIEVPDEIKEKVFKVGEDGKDPLFEAMLPKFHELGLNQEGVISLLSGMGEYLERLSEAGDNSEFSGDIQYEALGGPDKAKPEIDGARVWLEGLKNSGKVSEATTKELDLLTYHSEGLSALRELRSLMGDKIIPNNIKGESSGDGTLSEAMLNERVADPRYRHGSKNFSQKFYDDTEKMFAEFYDGKKSA